MDPQVLETDDAVADMHDAAEKFNPNTEEVFKYLQVCRGRGLALALALAARKCAPPGDPPKAHGTPRPAFISPTNCTHARSCPHARCPLLTAQTTLPTPSALSLPPTPSTQPSRCGKQAGALLTAAQLARARTTHCAHFAEAFCSLPVPGSAQPTHVHAALGIHHQRMRRAICESAGPRIKLARGDLDPGSWRHRHRGRPGHLRWVLLWPENYGASPIKGHGRAKRLCKLKGQNQEASLSSTMLPAAAWWIDWAGDALPGTASFTELYMDARPGAASFTELYTDMRIQPFCCFHSPTNRLQHHARPGRQGHHNHCEHVLINGPWQELARGQRLLTRPLDLQTLLCGHKQEDV